MSVTLVKRGIEENVLSTPLSAGELALATDTGALYARDDTGTKLVGRCLQDDLGNRPFASVQGRFFWANDTNQLFVDDGDTWNLVSGGGGGGSSWLTWVGV
jgi:hypothetical protein